MKKKSRLLSWSEYLSIRSYALAIDKIPENLALKIARSASPVYSLISKKRVTLSLENISLSFPELSKVECQRLLKNSLGLWMEIFGAETLLIPKILGNSSWENKIKFEILPETEKILRNEKPALLITGHMGNWEVLGWVLSKLGFPVSAVARPLDNKPLNDWVEKIRQKHGLNLISKFGATNSIKNSLQQGQHIGFIADQNGGEKGIFVPFFGRLASTYKSIGLLALSNQTPIVVAHTICHRNPIKWTVKVIDTFGPEDWEDTPDPLYYITARFTKAIEAGIRYAPAQYFWMHRRWKSRPKFEKENKSPPKKLINQLESLPWMNDELIKSIIHQV